MLLLSLLSPLGVTLGMAARVYFSEHEHLAGRLLLSGLKASIIFNTLGAAVSMFESEPHVPEGFGASLDDFGHIHHLWAGVWRTDSSLEPLHICSGSMLEPIIESNSSNPQGSFVSISERKYII